MISHHHKTIFVHIPKCGGQSVEQMYLDDLGLTWETRGPLLLRRNEDPNIGPPRLGHLIASEYVGLGHISQNDFDAFYKFAVVRDPYKRVLSTYNYLMPKVASSDIAGRLLGERRAKKYLGGKPVDLDRFIHEWLPAQLQPSPQTQFWFVRTQFDYVADAAGNVMVDDVIKLEEIGQKIDAVRERSGLTATLPHRNKSKNSASLQDFAPDHLKKIEELYAVDFEAFGYPILSE